MDENKKEETKQNNTQEEQKPRTRKTRKTAGNDTVENKSSKKEKDLDKVTEIKELKEPSSFEESVQYLKSIGLKKVSNKTFINEADLEAFLDGDFTNINKTRALGFIQILEREYPVKLEELKKAYLSYHHQQGQNKEQKEIFLHPKAENDHEWKKYFIWIAPLVLAGGVSLFYFGQEKSELSKIEAEEKLISTDINTDIVIEAEKNLTQYEKQTQLALKQEEPIVASDRVSPFIREGASSNKTVVQKSVPSGKESKGDDLDLDLMVKQMVKEYNLTTDKEILPEKVEDNKSMAPKDILVKNVPSVTTTTTETNKQKVQSKTEKKEIKKTKKDLKKSTNSKVKKTSKDAINSRLYIVPHKKSWVGIIYLDDYTKRDFLIRKTLKLNPKRPQLIVVGQKEFEIFNNGYSYRFRGKGPVRFIYKDGDIMEITNREFKAYSKGTSW